MSPVGTACECKHCSKQSQRNITSQIASRGIVVAPPAVRKKSTTSPSPTPSSSQPRQASISVPSTSRRRSPEPKKQKRRRLAPRSPSPAPIPTLDFCNVQKCIPNASRIILESRPQIPDLEKDVRAVNIDSTLDEISKRRFRPGELVWCDIEKPIRPKPKETNVEIRFWPGLVEECNFKADVTANTKGQYVYSVKFLALPQRVPFQSDRLLPYQAHAPPQAIVERMSNLSPDELSYQRETLYHLAIITNVGPGRPSFNQTLPIFAVALEIARDVRELWTLTDEFNLQFTVPRLIKNADSISAVASEQRQTINQPHFLGLWWGPERIWVGDLVRLKLSRRSFAPEGIPGAVLPPSGPGPGALEEISEHRDDVDMGEMGAQTRGLFMHIKRLFVTEKVSTDGTLMRECRVAGKIYELADADWKEEDVAMVSKDDEDAADYVPLPQAPKGYNFRGILASDYECICAISVLSGRYYPRILFHPLLADKVQEIVSAAVDSQSLVEFGHLVCLEGLEEGIKNAVEPTRYKLSRPAILQEADRTAVARMEKFADSLRQAQKDDEFEEEEEAESAERTAVDVDELFSE